MEVCALARLAGDAANRGYGPEEWASNVEEIPDSSAATASSSEERQSDPEDDFFDRALDVFEKDFDAAKRLQEELRPSREEWYQLYRGKHLEPGMVASDDYEAQQLREDDGRSKIVSTDTMDAIEWIQPSLARIFFSSDIVSAVGIGPEDEEAAEKTAELINYMFMRRGNGFTKAMHAMKSALVYSAAFIKTGWKTEFKRSRFVEQVMTQEEFDALKANPDVKIKSFSEDVVPYSPEEFSQLMTPLAQQIPPDMPPEAREALMAEAVKSLPERKIYRDVVGTQLVEDYSGFTIDVVPPEDFLYDPTAENIEDAHFVIHRVFRTVDYLKRMEIDGVYKNVDQVIENIQSRIASDAAGIEKQARYAEDNRNAPWIHQDNQDQQLGRRVVEVFEWWGLFDPNDSGMLEPYVIVVAEDVVLRCEPNPYDHGQPPFIALVPIPDLHKFEGISLADILGDIQKIKTSVIRQILDNFSYQNNQMWLIERNARVEMAAVLNPRPGRIVRTDNINGIRQITPQPLHPWAFQFVEFMQAMAEQRTGVTRYNQGLDAQSLNKTATGVTAILGASQARIELIARMFAEGWQKVFTQCLALLRQFMPHDYVVRLYGEPIRVSRDDVSGNMDILVSCGVAAGKSERVQGQLIQLLQLLAPLLQNGVMTPDNLYELMKRLMELWGFKDHSKLLSDPNFIKTLQEQLMMMQQQLQVQAMQNQQAQSILSHPLVQQAAKQAMQDRQLQAAIGAAQPQTHPSQQPSQPQPQPFPQQPQQGVVPVGGGVLPQMEVPPGQGGGMGLQ
jgi:hypothetical protein